MEIEHNTIKIRNGATGQCWELKLEWPSEFKMDSLKLYPVCLQILKSLLQSDWKYTEIFHEQMKFFIPLPMTCPCPNLDKSPFEMIMIRGSLRERENCVVSPKLHLALVPQNEFSFVAPIS